MKRTLYKLSIVLLIMLFFVSPVFAQEAAEESVVADKDVMFVGDLGEGVLTGEVASLDLNSSTITVKFKGGDARTFSVIMGETILWRGIEDIELSDIKKGQEAEVGYYTDGDNKLIASWVDVFEEELLPVKKETAPETVPVKTEAVTEVSPKDTD
ncbi:hypothetical protein ACFL0P_06230 [Candidatus Omnitrophota bacterium]